MKTTRSARPAEVQHAWYVIDAEGQVLGRLATRIATVIRGKHKPDYTPHVDMGDFVIVLNAGKVVFTGRKLDQKQYHRYSGRFGGLKSQTAREVMAAHPERIVMAAVKGMLPKNRLGRRQLTKLKVYAGPEHPHRAQCPEPFPAHI